MIEQDLEKMVFYNLNNKIDKMVSNELQTKMMKPISDIVRGLGDNTCHLKLDRPLGMAA